MSDILVAGISENPQPEGALVFGVIVVVVSLVGVFNRRIVQGGRLYVPIVGILFGLVMIGIAVAGSGGKA
ncbi:hypothetical protein ACIBTZ_26490 [Micromonospora sp. NPDC049460]|uniref:hypothetical protein n=1 Tax=Micromonospora sp. NPDC049460 TaxID=3364272 RepID=UPI0037B98673